jgi:hypothetical protein
MITLSIKQQSEFEKLASVGCSIPDCLIVGCGFTPVEASKVAEDPELRSQWEASRARGAAKIMLAMATAGAKGSSSAAKLALAGHAVQAEAEQERIREGRRGDIVDVLPSVAAGELEFLMSQNVWWGASDVITLADGTLLTKKEWEERSHG